VKNQGDIKKVNNKGDAVEDTKGDRDKHVTSVVQKKWKSISAGRAEECLREAMRRGGKPLNTSRLNIVGEGRAGKTAWLRAVSNKAFEDTPSTIGVKQSLLEVTKVHMETKCEGGWSVVEGGTLIMKSDEAITRLAAQIAVTEEEASMSIWEMYEWQYMPPQFRAHWEVLGYNERNWEQPNTAGTPPPRTETLRWQQLSPLQQASASAVGYSEEMWDAGTPSTCFTNTKVQNTDRLRTQSRGGIQRSCPSCRSCPTPSSLTHLRTGLQPRQSGTPPPLQSRVLRCLKVLSLPLSLLALQYTEY
jgi:hypothetical protein